MTSCTILRGLLAFLGLLGLHDTHAAIIAHDVASVRLILVAPNSSLTTTKGSSVDWIQLRNRTILGVGDPTNRAIYMQELTPTLSSFQQLPITSGKLRPCYSYNVETPNVEQSQFGRTIKFQRAQDDEVAIIVGSPTMPHSKGSASYGQLIFMSVRQKILVLKCVKGKYTGLALATDAYNGNGNGSATVAYSDVHNIVTVESFDKPIMRLDKSEKDAENYFGFAVALRGNTLAMSAPRGLHSRGFVIFRQTSNGVNEARINGTQVGSHFGYSLAIGYAGSKRDVQVIVGNPFWLDTESWTEDVGEVDVNVRSAACKADCVVRRRTIRSPRSTRQGRFGAAVVTTDLNQDGHDDLLVGEPGDGRNLTGALHVYLFDPVSDSIMNTPHQSLLPTQFTNDSVQLFGHSLAANVDVDNNGFPDIVASFLRNGTLSLAIFRTRPTVSLTASVSTPLENLIDHDRSWNCSALTFDLPGCLAVRLCLSYNSDSSKQAQYVVEVQLHADSEFSSPRVNFVADDRNQTRRWSNGTATVREQFVLTNRRESCRVWFLQSEYVAQQTEAMKRVLVSFTYNLANAADSAKDELGFLPLQPLLINGTNYSSFGQLTESATLFFKNLCGVDQLCEIDMTTTAVIPKKFVLGSSKLEVVLNVVNWMEAAYSALLNITFPAAFTVSVIDELNVALQCHLLGNDTDVLRSFLCYIGNPFPGLGANHSTSTQSRHTMDKGYNRTYLVTFGTSDFKLPPRSANLQFVNVSFNLSSDTEMSSEVNPADNFKMLTIPFAHQLSLEMDAQAHPDQMFLDRDEKLQLNEEVTYIYQLKSLREAGVRGFRFNITRVNDTVNGQALLKLISIEANGERLYCTEQSVRKSPNANANANDRTNNGGRITKRDTQLSDQTAADTWWPFSLFWSQASKRTEMELDCAGDQGLVRCIVHCCDFRLIQQEDVVTLKVKVLMNPTMLLSLDPTVVTLLVPTRVDAEVIDLSYVESADIAQLRRFIPSRNFTAHRVMQFPVSFKVDQTVAPPPTWVLIVGIVGGVLMLVLIMALLVYCGFFKRKRPPTALQNNGTDENANNVNGLPNEYESNVKKAHSTSSSAESEASKSRVANGTKNKNKQSANEVKSAKKAKTASSASASRKAKANIVTTFSLSSAVPRQTLVQVAADGPHQFAPQLLQVPSSSAIPEKFLTDDD